MAITWRGSCVTPRVTGYPVNSQYVFALVNTFRSRHKINVLRFVAMGDSLERTADTAGHIMPLLKTWRCSCANITGGISVDTRAPWDTAINAPDPHVKVLYAGYDSGSITVSGQTGPAWEQYIQRQCTAVEQRRTIDNSMLSRLTSVEDFVLLPGQAIVVSWEQGTRPVGGAVFLNIAWEEDLTDAGYTLGGTVTLESAAVSSATVFVLTDSVVDMTNPELETFTTASNGTWSTTLATGVKAAAFVQHKDGSDLYTDEGKPFIEGP
jgi:hypothetical protein